MSNVLNLSDKFKNTLINLRTKIYKKEKKKVFFYCLTSHRWGHDAVEYLSLLNHAEVNNYIPVIICDTLSRNINRLRKVKLNTDVKVYFYCVRILYKEYGAHNSVLNPQLWKRWVSNKDQINASEFSDQLIGKWTEKLWWPYLNPMKVSLHMSEFVHHDFLAIHMDRMKYDTLLMSTLENTRCEEVLSDEELHFFNQQITTLFGKRIDLENATKIAICLRFDGSSQERNNSVETLKNILSILSSKERNNNHILMFYGSEIPDNIESLIKESNLCFLNCTKNNRLIEVGKIDSNMSESILSEQLCLTSCDFTITADSGSSTLPYVQGKPLIMIDAYAQVSPLTRCIYLPRGVDDYKLEPYLCSSVDMLKHAFESKLSKPDVNKGNTIEQLSIAIQIADKLSKHPKYTFPGDIVKTKIDYRLPLLNTLHYSRFSMNEYYSRLVVPAKGFQIERDGTVITF